MKKVISLFLAATVLCLTTSAMANPSTGSTVTGERNGVNTMPTSTSTAMPCFRPGDTINFTVSGLTSGEELTIISYKNGATPADANVQYINQYTVSGNQAVSYTIRNQVSGIYKLVLTGTQNNSSTFYYKVGREPSLQAMTGNGENSGTFTGNSGTPYVLHYDAPSNTYSIGFIGKITFENDSVNFSDIGAHPGFSITHGGTTKEYGFGLDINGVDNTDKTVANLDGLEIAGSYSFIYGVTVKGIPVGQQTGWTAQAVLDAAAAE